MYMHICSATSAMWCALHAMTSWGCRAAAMCAVPGPPVATTGAMPWSSWWTPSVFRARTLAMAAPIGRCITTVKATARVCPHMPCRCPGQACGFVGSISPPCTDGPAQPRLRLVLASALNSVMVSISSPLSVLLRTKSPRNSTCSC
jgi:hypothetical protein